MYMYCTVLRMYIELLVLFLFSHHRLIYLTTTRSTLEYIHTEMLCLSRMQGLPSLACALRTTMPWDLLKEAKTHHVLKKV